MPYEITVIRLGPPGEAMDTICEGKSFVCPVCKHKVRINLCEGIYRAKYPEVPLTSSNCKSKYGIATAKIGA